jgi:ribonuclease VapC
MVVDTSALLAVLFGEPEAERIAQSITSDPRRLASAFTVLETSIVVEARKGEPGGRELDLLLHRIDLESVPLTASHVEVARDAWRRFGRGHHRANLNIGDCCTYALARISGEPVLFKGDDFAQTDAVRVEY